MRQQPRPYLVRIVACCVCGAKPLSESMLNYHQNIISYIQKCSSRKMPWKTSGFEFVSVSMCKWIKTLHDDVIKWKHFPCYWPFVRGIHRSPVSSPHKGQWRGAWMFSLICAWINNWVNNREAGDFRCPRGHYDVIVMVWGVGQGTDLFDIERRHLFFRRLRLLIRTASVVGPANHLLHEVGLS